MILNSFCEIRGMCYCSVYPILLRVLPSLNEVPPVRQASRTQTTHVRQTISGDVARNGAVAHADRSNRGGIYDFGGGGPPADCPGEEGLDDEDELAAMDEGVDLKSN